MLTLTSREGGPAAMFHNPSNQKLWFSNSSFSRFSFLKEEERFSTLPKTSFFSQSLSMSRFQRNMKISFYVGCKYAFPKHALLLVF
jgi:hypothetical protein